MSQRSELLQAGNRRKKILLTVLGTAAVIGVLFIAKAVYFAFHYERTDDAQIDGHIHPVLPRASGWVHELYVKENQFVHKDQDLLKIDPEDYRVKVEQAKAALSNAKANLMVARANGTAAAAGQRKAAADLKRYSELRKKDIIPESQFESVRAAADTTKARYEAAVSQIQVAASQVELRQAELESAELQLGYTTVRAPSDGKVTRKSVEVGQFVQVGQPLLTVVEDDDVWVSANFKETQLTKMRPGQHADIEVDAYPGVKFEGRVDSIAAGTGAKFALLPPDNATGNFVKVVQRVPVKILFSVPRDRAHPLRVGMNVIATVRVD